MDAKAFRASLAAKGVEAVRGDVAHKRYHGARLIEATAWLNEHGELKADDYDRQMLQAAQDGARAASSSAKAAWFAAIVAIASAVIAVIALKH